MSCQLGESNKESVGEWITILEFNSLLNFHYFQSIVDDLA